MRQKIFISLYLGFVPLLTVGTVSANTVCVPPPDQVIALCRDGHCDRGFIVDYRLTQCLGSNVFVPLGTKEAATDFSVMPIKAFDERTRENLEALVQVGKYPVRTGIYEFTYGPETIEPAKAALATKKGGVITSSFRVSIPQIREDATEDALNEVYRFYLLRQQQEKNKRLLLTVASFIIFFLPPLTLLAVWRQSAPWIILPAILIILQAASFKVPLYIGPGLLLIALIAIELIALIWIVRKKQLSKVAKNRG